MDARYLPETLEGKLDHVCEECAEVILAIQKFKRFGPGPNLVNGVQYPDHKERMRSEISDLISAVRRLTLALKS